MRTRIWAAAAVAVLASACSSDDGSADSARSPTTRAQPVAELVDRCEPGGTCAPGFTINGADYTTGCAAVLEDLVRESVASGTVSGRRVAAHLIDGVDQSIALAVDMPGGGCTDESELTSDWSFAFSTAASAPATQDALCRAGAPPPPEC